MEIPAGDDLERSGQRRDRAHLLGEFLVEVGPDHADRVDRGLRRTEEIIDDLRRVLVDLHLAVEIRRRRDEFDERQCLVDREVGDAGALFHVVARVAGLDQVVQTAGRYVDLKRCADT
jgi:hypothetical protein